MAHATTILFKYTYDSSKTATVIDELIQNIGKDDFEEKLLSIANILYKNDLTQKPVLPFQDRYINSGNHARVTDLKQLVIKFISAYKAAATPDD